MSVEIVFFDAGETLLRPEPNFRDAAAAVYRSRGHAVESQDIVRTGELMTRKFVEAAESGVVMSASPSASRDFWTSVYVEMTAALGLDDDGAPEALLEHFSDPASYGLFDDVVPCLDALAERGLRLGVISNFEAWLDPMLSSLGIKERFDVVAISGPLGVEKPDRRIFDWAVEQAGVAHSACAHVGDQPAFDSGPALELGMRGILLDRYGRWGGVEHPKVASLDELVDLL